MPEIIFYSNHSRFNAQDNPFTRFLLRHPIRLSIIDNVLHFVIRDVIESLGYAVTSTPYLTRKCRNRQRLRVPGPKGGTVVNVIPLEDLIMLVFHCSHDSYALMHLRKWFLAKAAIKSNEVLEDFISCLNDRADPENQSGQDRLEPGK